MRIAETDQTESTGAGAPENTSLQAVANPPKRPRKQAAAHAAVATKSNTLNLRIRRRTPS